MLQQLATWLFSLLFPHSPAWIGVVFSELFDAISDFVQDLESYKLMTGPEKLVYLVERATLFADKGLDDVPGWSVLDEAAKDRIYAGLAELALFFLRAQDEGVKPGAIRRAVRSSAKQFFTLPE